MHLNNPKWQAAISAPFSAGKTDAPAVEQPAKNTHSQEVVELVCEPRPTWVPNSNMYKKGLRSYFKENLAGGSVVKNPPTKAGAAGDWIRSLGGEDTLREEIATHSSTLAWKIPWTEKPGRSQSVGYN